jgi:hypothetical protein
MVKLDAVLDASPHQRLSQFIGQRHYRKGIKRHSVFPKLSLAQLVFCSAQCYNALTGFFVYA